MLSKSKIKYIQSLGQKKFRQEERLFIAEGPKIVAELIAAGAVTIKEIYALNEWINDNSNLSGKWVITEITEIELERISQLSTPNKVIAIIQQPEVPEKIVTKNKIVLALDGIQDPGNLGTIIRIADWFGIEQIVCSHECADIYNPKVVQSTMGSIARVTIFYTSLEEWLRMQKDARIYAATLEGKDVTTIKKLAEGIIVLGNESKGIHESIIQLAQEKITIAGKGKAESLNAGVAAGILLSHLC